MISLNKINSTELKEVWRLGYSRSDLEWINYDAPFLHSYQPLTWGNFKETEASFFYSKYVEGIFFEGTLIGAVSYYWNDEMSHWLEVGLVIFKETAWSQGYGTQALKKWTSKMFSLHQEVARVGFTTWSGNPGMIRLGEKCYFSLEGRVRQVRYYKGNYYDELYYGILRSEWELLATR